MKLSGFSRILPLASLVAALPKSTISPEPTRPFLRERQNSSCENTATNRQCWGDYNIDTNYYNVVPATGVTREYWLVAQNITLAPDGYERQVLCFNVSIPGPTISADWGDTLVIHVTNAMPDNGTAIHWHGMHQKHSINADGVPGVTQCPIAPGQTMTYAFQATQYGTAWYHSHFSLQLAQDLLGQIVIHGPATADYDVDLGAVVLQDWGHTSAFDIWATNQGELALSQPVMENGLINGLNPFDCVGSMDPDCVGGGKRFEVLVSQGRKYLLRLIGAQADGYFKFALDGHRLLVVEMDLVPIVPYAAGSVILGSGQRYDVVVEANQTVASYWMRAIYQTACNGNDNDYKNNILGIWRYKGAEETDPTTTVDPGITDSCGDEDYDKLVPSVPVDVGNAAFTDELLVQYYDLSLSPLGAVFKWTLHSKTLVVNWSSPITRDIYNDAMSFPSEDNVYQVNASNQWVFFIIQDLTLVDAFHPMHLHGHDFFVLARGEGLYTPLTVSLNTKNPPRRDTVSLYGDGYTVIAMLTDNPGSWLLHCHIAWHSSQGLAMNFVEREGEVASLVADDIDQYNSICEAWEAWKEVYEMDDSGI